MRSIRSLKIRESPAPQSFRPHLRNRSENSDIARSKWGTFLEKKRNDQNGPSRARDRQLLPHPDPEGRTSMFSIKQAGKLSVLGLTLFLAAGAIRVQAQDTPVPGQTREGRGQGRGRGDGTRMGGCRDDSVADYRRGRECGVPALCSQHLIPPNLRLFTVGQRSIRYTETA